MFELDGKNLSLVDRVIAETFQQIASGGSRQDPALPRCNWPPRSGSAARPYVKRCAG